MMNKLNYLLVLSVIFLASCATNEDSLNKLSDDRTQNVGIDLSEFQTQFPAEFDLLDFDALATTELEVQDGDVNRTSLITLIPVVDKGMVLGYAGEFEGAPFYSVINKDQLTNTDLSTGYTMSFPIASVKGEQTLDVENITPVNFVMFDENSAAEKGICEWACAAAGIACAAACTAVVVVGTAAATGASIPTTLGTAAPAVLIGAGAAQAACLAACVVAQQACLNNC